MNRLLLTKRGGRSVVALFSLLVVSAFLPAFVACRRMPSANVTVTPPVEAASPYPDFAVRSRFDDARSLSWDFDATESPIEKGIFQRAIERAIELWTKTGVVGFHRVSGTEAPQIFIAFKAAHHGTCRPFVNWDGEVAHTGPIGERIEIHIDRELEWSENGEKGFGVFQTVLHELGHALGLDHSTDPAALMYAKYGKAKSKIERSDLLGIQSLYGGGTDGPGDVLVARMHDEVGMTSREMMEAPTVTCVLRGIAPLGVSDFTFADVDGDNRDEIVTWRTDPAGHGALKYYFFDAKGHLRRTIGPMVGQMGVNRRPFFVKIDGKTPLLLSALPDGRFSGFILGEFGIPDSEWPRGRALDPDAGDIADTDGDGKIDQMPIAVVPKAGASREVRRGNLDGDGTPDESVRFLEVK